MANFVDINRLTLDELASVINAYPWYAEARLKLCEKLSDLGEEWIDSHLVEASLYISKADRLIKYKKSTKKDYADEEVGKLLKKYINIEEKKTKSEPKRKIHVIGGDYFSQEEYDKVRKADDNVFSQYASKSKTTTHQEPSKQDTFDLYTETLAEIYAEQGYYEQARDIYSKLILSNPEKSVYFASLIEKLNQEIKNN